MTGSLQCEQNNFSASTLSHEQLLERLNFVEQMERYGRLVQSTDKSLSSEKHALFILNRHNTTLKIVDRAIQPAKSKFVSNSFNI